MLPVTQETCKALSTYTVAMVQSSTTTEHKSKLSDLYMFLVKVLHCKEANFNKYKSICIMRLKKKKYSKHRQMLDEKPEKFLASYWYESSFYNYLVEILTV